MPYVRREITNIERKKMASNGKKLRMDCAHCNKKRKHGCYQGLDCTGMADELKTLWDDPKVKKMQRVATAIEGSFYMKYNRLQELMVFCKEMGYKKLGVAFCVGMSEEVERLVDLLCPHFEVISVMCKVCGIDKRDFGLKQIRDDRYEAICNPLGQAEILNRNHTDLNIIFGLCIGHDILFTQHSDAPVTTLVVKDRVLAHNPIGAVNSRYHRRVVENMEPVLPGTEGV
jgi:uncharacterized metal-binding protein